MKKIIILCISIIFSFTSVHAVDTRAANVYDIFQNKVEKNYSGNEKQEVYLKLRELLTLYSQENISSEHLSLAKDVLKLNNETLYEAWLSDELWNASQKILEISTRKTLSNQLKTWTLPSYVTTLTNISGIDYISVNDKREFVQSNSIYRVDYSNYFPVNSETVGALKSKRWIIVKASESDYRFLEVYEYEKKKAYSDLAEEFSHFITSNYKISEKNNSYIGYNFSKFRYFWDNYGVYDDQISSSGFDTSSTLLYRDEDGKFHFITDYQSHIIANLDDLYWVPDKQVFLDYLRDDALFETHNISWELAKIRAISESLTEWRNTEDSIKEIYNWILKNISYTKSINLEDQKIFSAIETFKNGEWVCTGYTKLSIYMFLFAGVYDAEVIRWHVVDAPDFPDIGHAWVRIGEYYYDPTFDDPVGASDTKTFEEYKYYKLPKDIFYANRFEYGDMPDGFESLSDEEIRLYIFNYLTKLLPKYSGQTDSYKVFAPVIFRNEHNIWANTQITPDFLATRIESYTVENNSSRFSKDGKNTSNEITSILCTDRW